jgi:hypothetical protein
MIKDSTTHAHDGRGQLTPEIYDALKTARRVTFRLEDEFHPFDWEARLELANMLREIAEDEEVPAATARAARAVQHRLESEASDFTDWEERIESANLARIVVAGLQEGGAR